MEHEGQCDDGRYQIQVNTVSDQPGVWTGNELRFDTPEHAWSYVHGLSLRWMAVADIRVVDLEGNVVKTAGWRDHG